MKIFKPWLNRDNFWNLMFWVLFALGLYCSNGLDKPMIACFTLVLTSLIIKKLQRLTLDKKRHFINRNGKSLKKQYPKSVGRAFFGSIIAWVVFFSGLDLIGIRFDMPNWLGLSFISIGFVSYFIYINCPISILFYKKAWSKKVLEIYPDFDNTHTSTTSTSTSSYTTDPAYRSLSCNIFNSGKR